jgi:hypothetical protein
MEKCCAVILKFRIWSQDQAGEHDCRVGHSSRAPYIKLKKIKILSNYDKRGTNLNINDEIRRSVAHSLAAGYCPLTGRASSPSVGGRRNSTSCGCPDPKGYLRIAVV